MSQDLATRFIGYAPDQRDRDNPPEVVYWTETPKRAPLAKLGLIVAWYLLLGALINLIPT